VDLTPLTHLLANHSHDWDHGWWPVFPLLWIAVIATIAWLLSRRRWSGGQPRNGADRARDILAERFARGEIAADEYRERLEQLR